MAWLILTFLSASKASACAVCGVYGDDPSSLAFLQGTALLSLAPMAMIGGTVYYLYRITKKAKQTQLQDVPLASPVIDRP